MVMGKQSREVMFLPGLSGADGEQVPTQGSWWPGLGEKSDVGAAPGLAVSWPHVGRQRMECPGPQRSLATFRCHFLWFQVET